MPTSSAVMTAAHAGQRSARLAADALADIERVSGPGRPAAPLRRAAPVASEKTASGKSISSQISQARRSLAARYAHQGDMAPASAVSGSRPNASRVAISSS